MKEGRKEGKTSFNLWNCSNWKYSACLDVRFNNLPRAHRTGQCCTAVSVGGSWRSPRQTRPRVHNPNKPMQQMQQGGKAHFTKRLRPKPLWTHCPVGSLSCGLIVLWAQCGPKAGPPRPPQSCRSRCGSGGHRRMRRSTTTRGQRHTRRWRSWLRSGTPLEKKIGRYCRDSGHQTDTLKAIYRL
jgi:hypothetical protein